MLRQCSAYESAMQLGANQTEEYEVPTTHTVASGSCNLPQRNAYGSVRHPKVGRADEIGTGEYEVTSVPTTMEIGSNLPQHTVYGRPKVRGADETEEYEVMA